MSGALAYDNLPRVLDAESLHRATVRLAHEIAEHHDGGDGLLLAGIRTRGVPLAERVATALRAIGWDAAEVCAVDVAGFRDDRPHPAAPHASAVTDGNGGAVQVTARTVVLVDDVLFTGRTVRAAMDALVAQGRPGVVEVLALIDRGHRELPVRATYVGKNVPTSECDRVRVRLREVDGVDGAWLVPGATP
ncbi:MAG: bifunctional pyr operon transcriptional regulator/uracil phosphoribosyltransferase PyrR [Candidatus Dormibacteraeota bacterium]|nr:bifunctional pyr operon transcriptional regulator/uracil phosphoribosyltransferase PyrR [Candidatus Dormibacteraeota bacterium]MBV8445971.1 bifunctional pyr operon transcriptional regulator/uracil phosphoribosyltransferase PyrR [Candidatus Dormibacteraeota bacterium]